MRFLSSILVFLLGSSIQRICAANICTLTVPANPLSAAGLATPYIQNGCSQGAGSASFVQGAVIDLDTGVISVYNPLVVDAGSQAAIAPVVPKLPVNSVVGLWFGTNGDATLLQGTNIDGVNSLVQGECIDGGGQTFSRFGQFAACNARAFFDAAKNSIIAGKLQVPALGRDFNGKLCPTTRDFGIVDQDPSDNVVSQYLLTTTKQVAQNTPANVATFAAKKVNTTTLTNGSDEGLLSLFVNNAIGCSVWKVPDLADTTGKQMVASLPTNEIQAGLLTVAPAAFIPAQDPMALDANGNPDINKLNAYRTSVNQFPVTNLNQAKTQTFCSNLYRIGAPKILTWLPRLLKAPSPNPANPNLGSFLITRFNAAVGADNLNCVQLLNRVSPLANKVDANGKVIQAIVVTDMDAAVQNLQVQDMEIEIDQFNDPQQDPNNMAMNTPTTTTTTANNTNDAMMSKNFNLLSLFVGFGVAVVISCIILAIRRVRRSKNASSLELSTGYRTGSNSNLNNNNNNTHSTGAEQPHYDAIISGPQIFKV